MRHPPESRPARFGTVLGIAPGNVPVYSSDYDSADRQELPNRHAYRSMLDGVFMGYKWQCVEFARRWMYVNHGMIFEDIAMAYDIFQLRWMRRVHDGTLVPLRSFRNGSRRWPEPGCLLIWNEGGEFELTGHVAVVTEVLPDRLRCVEQNVDHQVWPEGQQWSRELPALIDSGGGYWVECTYPGSSILGWVVQTADDTLAEDVTPPAPYLYRIFSRTLEAATTPSSEARTDWLNPQHPAEAAFVQTLGGQRLSTRARDENRYLCISETAAKELKRATNELHALFMHATDHVLQDDTLLARFNLPRALWPRLHRSWDNRKNQMITGRFDFCMGPEGVKLYEYNCDSASCHMETGLVQGAWARHAGCREGRDAGEQLTERLITAWKTSQVDGLLHILQDIDAEETYHALYMREAMHRAGLRTRVMRGLSGLHWTEDGDIVDSEGDPIRWVWKTWAWETALDQLRAECDEDDLRLPGSGRGAHERPRLVDVLLRPDVLVFEPLWTLIPSNKAILPILWELFPGHPYLLESHYLPNDRLKATGYVSKPIAGRCGLNISLFDRDAHLVTETGGRFEHQNLIYQQLCRLPVVEGDHVQLCTFSVDGTYAGACVRVDESAVITTHSDVIPLRILPDESFPR